MTSPIAVPTSTVARNARTRFSTPASGPTANDLHGVEVRDLQVYEQLPEIA